MANLEAAAVVHGGSLSRTHPHTPAIDVLDLVMKVRIDRVLDFAQPPGSLAKPGSLFGELLAAAIDEAIDLPPFA